MNFKLIELSLATTTRVAYFKGNTVLNNVKTVKLITLNSSNATYTADGNTVIAADRSISAFLTIKDRKGKIIFDRIPYDEFNREINGGIIPSIPEAEIDWDNSFVELGQAIASASYAVIGVYYK